MSISYVRHRASELDKSFRIRSFLEQGTCLLGIASCVVAIILAPHVWVKVGVALLLLGVVHAMVQWRRRAVAHAPEAFESSCAGLVFYRRELERKREIHRTLWRWYLLPMVPGIAVILLWSFFGDPHTKGTLTPWTMLGMLAVWIAFALIYERAKAAQCQREIDALASLEGDIGLSARRQP